MERFEQCLEITPEFMGELSEMKYEEAVKYAPLHPNVEEYYKKTMMPLFQGKGIFSKGTENPVLALESLKSKKESEIDMPYMLIWKVLK